MSNTKLVRTVPELEAMVAVLRKEPILACDLETSELTIRKTIIEGIGLGTNKIQYFISFPNAIPESSIISALTATFEGNNVLFHNAKYDLEVLAKYNYPWPKKFQDTMIMSWLADENTAHGLKPLSVALFGREPKKWTDLNRKIDLFTDKEQIAEDLADYCGDDVINTFDLYFYFLPILEKEGLMLDYERIELKMILVLTRMELRGIRVDVDWLNQKAKELEKVLLELEKKIKKSINNENLNVRSPVQLESILFDVLGYEPIRVTDKNKRSTDNEVLEDLVKINKLGEDDFVPLLLKFRDLDKLHGTYFVSLAEQAGEEKIIHPNFMQHGARTGRLSCNDPNLQNIPTRADEYNVRKAFIPREGYKFILADYSQIELRMLAHFSQDESMVKTFVEDGDIHATTMKHTGVKDRKVAKGINFGLIYGMGPRTLAHTLSITEENAKKYMDKFFQGYPKVKRYIESVQGTTFRDGYVTMITGRRRRFQEIKDKRWFGLIQRQSINTKIQGSAADLIKIAMIKLGSILPNYDSHILVQIHDEVIVETPIDKVAEVEKIIIETMENAVKLRVPIKVKAVVGDCWIKD